MKNYLVFGAFACSLFLFAAEGCKKDASQTTDCSGIDATANTFNNGIAAILAANCATSGCHDAITVESNLNFSTYASAKSAFQNADVLCAINHDGGCEPMPSGGDKLSDAAIQKIECWVENGYRE